MPQNRLGSLVRPQGHYQLELTMAEHSEEPRSVSIVAGPLRRSNGEQQRFTEDGNTITRFDLHMARQDEGAA